MALVELTLFGGFELQRSSGEAIGLPGQKERALLAVLALRPGASQSRDKLAGLLWGDRGDKQARDSLKHSVTRLREGLSSITPPPVVSDRQSVRLDPAALVIDVALFEQLLRDGTLEALERAATLYRGDLLEGFTIHDAGFEDWLAAERQRLRHSVEEALTKVMAQSMSARANDRAAVAARRLLLLDPLREVACRTLMQIEAARAQTAQALKLYEVLRERLRRELGVKPEPATTQLYESIRLRRAGSALPIAPLQGETVPRTGPTRARLPLPSKPSIAVLPFMDARRRRRLSFLAAAALVPLVAGIGAWLHLRPGETAAVAHMALPLPDKPSIAVLPFDNLSADPEQGYFVDGMTEDLITDLSKLSGIFVIARNSSWTYKGKPAKPQKVAEDLGVRYVLEGSVQRQGDQVRINAQLIDAIGGQHLWADRYDGTMSDVFGLQDRVIRQIVTALAVELTGPERAGAAEETRSPAAYDALLRGWDHLRKDQEDETLKAIASFEKAIELDRGYGRAYAALAAANLRIVVAYWEAATGAGFEHANERMRENLSKALEHPTSLAYAVSGEVLGREGRYEEAFGSIEKAIALAPGDPENYVAKARVLNASGHAAEAEQAVRKAMRLDPNFAPRMLRVLTQAYFQQEKYQQAIDTLERVLSQQSDVAEDYATLVSSLGHLGRRDGVQDAIDKYNAGAPKEGYDQLTVQEMGWWWYDDMFNYDDTYRERLLEGLRKAGVPEGAGTDLAYADYRRRIVKKNGEYVVLGATEIEAPAARTLHDRGAIFVDVRAPTDFNGGHIPGAKNLSLGTHLSKESLAKLVGKDDEVVFSCFGKYCSYSAYASAKALLWGYTHVYRFAGGFPAWQDAGYPTETAAGQ